VAFQRTFSAWLIVTSLLVAGAAPRDARAAAPVAIEKLSTAQRASTASDSTAVTVTYKGGKKVTTTLGKLRSAHKAREAARGNAKTVGLAAHDKLAGKPLTLVPIKTHPVYTGHSHKPFIPKYVGGVSHGLGAFGHLPATMIEPSSMYGSAPGDMKAFCAAAQASACAYLPAQQTVSVYNGVAEDFDTLISGSQCVQEGGTVNSLFGLMSCYFGYPASVTVPFTPAADYKLSQSAVCTSPWTYGVDPHGAISIQLSRSGTFSTGDGATCIVRIKVGP
jgi:hypothetical protein